MSRNLVRNFDADEHENGLGNVADFVQAAKPKPTRVYFYALPNYATDRRSDPRVRDSESAMMLPYSDGYLERFESIALPGFYFVELRSGREIVSGEVCEVKAKEVRASTEPESNGHGQPVVSAVDTVRATKELMRELMPQGQQSGVAKEEIAEMIKAAVASASPAPKESSVISGLRELMSLQREMNSMNPPPRGNDLDDEERLYVAAMKKTDVLGTVFKSMREMVATPTRESNGISERIFGLLETFVESSAPHVVPQLMSRMMAAAPGTNAATQQHPVASPQAAMTAPQSAPVNPRGNAPIPDDPNEASAMVMRTLAYDLTRDRRVHRSIERIEQAIEKHPAFKAIFDVALEMDNAQLLAALQEQTGFNLAACEHALTWIEEFKAVWFADNEDEPEAQSEDLLGVIASPEMTMEAPSAATPAEPVSFEPEQPAQRRGRPRAGAKAKTA